MILRRLQGGALILSAICLLVGRFVPGLTVSNGAFILALVGVILFMIGIPSIQLFQPEGLFGWIGILLLEVSALIALAFLLSLINSSGLAFTSAILGMLGRVTLGYLTVRRHRFPAWAGWAFILAGIINLLAGVVNFGTASEVMAAIAVVLDAVALFGYGYRLLR